MAEADIAECRRDLQESMNEAGQIRVAKIIKLLTVCKQKRNPSEWDPPNNVDADLLRIIRLFLVDRDRQVRVQGARAVRYLMWNEDVLADMRKYNIPIFMCRCLEREENRYLWERMQALKWVRHMMELKPESVPRPVCMSLIAIANHPKDEFRRICLDTLRELLLRNAELVASCNGVKTIIDCILDPELADVANSLVLTLLYVLDHPSTRRYLRPGLDVRKLIAPFVELKPKKIEANDDSHARKEEVAQRTLMTMLKSVTGIFYLASDPHCLRALVELMKLPNSIEGYKWSRQCMFEILEEILAPLSDNKKLDDARGPNLVVNYVALILMAFIKNGLIEALVTVGLRHDVELAPRARSLLTRIQLLAARYLPKSLCAKISYIPPAVDEATTFKWDRHEALKYRSQLNLTVSRNYATNMVIELAEVTESESTAESAPVDQERIQAVHLCHRLGPTMDLNSTFVRYRYMMDRDIPAMMFQDRIPYHCHHAELPSDDTFGVFSFRAQRTMILEKLKEDQNASYTEVEIYAMLRKSQVVNTKDFMLWRMEEVWNVLNGPLWHLPNLQAAMRSKFIKRLLSYLRPSRTFFSQLKWTPNTFQHALCACQLFRLMTSCDAACDYSHFTDLVKEIFKAVKNQLECNLNPRRPELPHAPFSRSGIATTLSRVYIILIGILSESPRGIKFFHTHDMFSFLFPLTRKEVDKEHGSGMTKDRTVGPNDYLLRLLAVNLDYTREENFRMLFSSWIATGSFYLRKTLILHLELLYRAQMPRFDEWSINVLAVLLKQETRLALTALKVLEKINVSQSSSSSRGYIVDLIHTQPTDQVVGQFGQFLFIKMLSTPEGLKFLRQTKWLDKTRVEWVQSFNRKYTKMLETALVLAVNNAQLNEEIMSSSPTEEEESEEKKAPNKKEDNSGGGSSNASSEAINWLPYHLIHEHKTDEEELYHEYLTHFPWKIEVKIIYPTGQEVDLGQDCFFDYNCFVPPRNKEKYPQAIGAGIHAIVLDKSGLPKPYHVDKSAKVRIRLGIGHECMVDYYSKKVRQKTVQLSEAERRSDECSIIIDGQVYFFFEPGPVEKNGRRDTKHSYLSRIFFSVREQQKSHSLVRPLPHFFGELAKTKQGCQYIQEKGDLDEFVRIVHSAAKSAGSSQGHLELRSALWALGMIGSSPTGLQMLNRTDIVTEVSDMAMTSPTLSIRGTCLYVLGLFSRTAEGMRQLSGLGFDFPADNGELDLAVAIPTNINKFFQLSKTNYVTTWPCSYDNKISVYSPPSLARPINMKPMDPNELLGQPGLTEQTVLAHISALCNHVTQKSSAHSLHKLHSKKPSVFSNPLLLRESLKLLTSYQFKLPARRFIFFQLFDSVLLDDSTIHLFDESLGDPIISHKDIREWRYNHKAKLIERKRRNKQQRSHPNTNLDSKKLSAKASVSSQVSADSEVGSMSPRDRDQTEADDLDNMLDMGSSPIPPLAEYGDEPPPAPITSAINPNVSVSSMILPPTRILGGVVALPGRRRQDSESMEGGNDSDYPTVTGDGRPMPQTLPVRGGRNGYRNSRSGARLVSVNPSNEIADSPTRDIIGPNPLALDQN